jgi:hypothetical protein
MRIPKAGRFHELRGDVRELSVTDEANNQDWLARDVLVMKSRLSLGGANRGSQGRQALW